MKIRDKLQITFITIALSFAVIGYIEHQYIAEIADSFRTLETQKSPSLTALLEMTAATRRASIKAMEYSMRGKSKDRAKALDALQQIDQEFEQYRAFSSDHGVTDINDLLAKKEQLTHVITDFLMISEGPAIAQMISEQEMLHQARSNLIGTIKDLMPKVSDPLKYNLLLIKSEARKVSIKLVEYTLRGDTADQQKALDAMQELRSAQIKYAAADATTPLRAGPITQQVTAYLSVAEHYLQQVSARQYAVENVYVKEEELHAARKTLIHALYPLIEHHYEKLGQAANTTLEDIKTSGRLQIYSVILVTLIAIIAAVFLARSISTPLIRLSSLVYRFGRGESIATEEIPTGGAQELHELGNAVIGMMRDREVLETSLKSSETRYRGLFENMSDGVAVYEVINNGQDFIFNEYNRAGERIGGLPRDKVIGRSVREIFPGVEELGLFEVFQRVWNTGEAEHKPVSHYQDEQLMIWVENYVFKLPSGEIVAIYEDVTERKRVETALRESEERWQFALEGSRDGVWDWDTIKNEVFYSRRWKEMLGYVEDEISNSLDEWDKRVHPEDKEQCYADLDRHFNGEAPFYENEHRVQCKDGSYKWILDRGKVVSWTADNKPLRVIGTHTDITERKQAETALTVSEERYRNLVESSQDWIWEVNDKGVYTYASPRCESLLGYSPEEIVGRAPFELMPAAEADRVRDKFLQLISAHAPIKALENTNQHKDGQEVVLETSGMPFFDSNGRLAGYRGMDRDITERKQAEVALRNSEAYVRMLFETSPVGLALCRMDGTLVEINPTYAEIIGRNVSETLGLSYWEITPDDYSVQEEAQLSALKQTGHYGPYEKEYLHKKGHRIPVRLVGRLIERDGQQYIWSAVEDITTLHQAAQLENRLQQLLKHSFEEIYIFMGDSLHFIEVSKGAMENLGYSMAELCELTPVDLKPDFSTETFNDLIEPLRTGEHDLLVFETRQRRKDGSHYPVEVRLQYSRKERESVFFTIIVDLTERKRTEAELELHREHLERLVKERTATIRQQAQIIDQTHDSVVTTDLEGIVTSWNGGAKRLFGISAEEALGRHISLIYPESEHEFLAQQVTLPLMEHGLLDTEVRLLHADGAEFPAHLSLSLLYNDDGEPRGMVGYTIDMSELKQREMELNRLANQLQISNKELESFSYSVSHDLRAPLRAIDGFSLALLEDYGDQLDQTAHDYMQRVRGGAQRMGVLIDDMLQLSRVNRGELRLTEVDLGDIAKDILEELQTLEPDRRLVFTQGEDLRVKGDVRLLRVMLNNLLGNAWKFTSREATSLIVFQRQPDAPEIFTIRDNGVGFDMRYADKLFGAFQRLHRVTDFPGTGVGLATVQRIIHRHGGKIWAEAQENEGATFYFTLEEDA